ncbi:hypothetical protein [Amycolatopsis magusensis]|uniref:hypothetical protein n=1 Tax=Amycolatopsis magusensis TaxID=882444 RepID=UPI003C2FF2F1
MGSTNSNLTKLTKLQEEFDTVDRLVIRETGGTNRDALLRLSELAGQMAAIHEVKAAELRRVQAHTYDMAVSK